MTKASCNGRKYQNRELLLRMDLRLIGTIAIEVPQRTNSFLVPCFNEAGVFKSTCSPHMFSILESSN